MNKENSQILIPKVKILIFYICFNTLILLSLPSCNNIEKEAFITATSEKFIVLNTLSTITPINIQAKNTWFPPTNTPSPKELYTPQKEVYPTPFFNGFITENAFNLHEYWSNVGVTENGSITFDNDSILMSISEPKVRLSSQFNMKLPTTYFLSVQINLNMCSTGDEAGVLINILSPNNLIRYGISCEGKIQIVRVIDGKPIISLPWQENSAISIGAPSINTLEIWVDEGQLFFYANDRFVYSLKEKHQNEAYLGIYGKTTDAKAFSVSFANLKLYQVPKN